MSPADRSRLHRTIVFAVLLVAATALLELGPWFESARTSLRRGVASAGPGARVEALLQDIGVATTPPGFLARGRSAPSSRVVAPELLEEGQLLLSLVVSEADLDDPVHGIRSNPSERGRDWERPGWLSVFRGTELEFATRVGVRLHGGSSRASGREAFRLYFRPSLGLPAVPRTLIEAPELPPERLVVRRSQMRPQLQPVAFAIARRIGAVAPIATSVRFALNGRLRNSAYELSEHVSRAGWGRSYFGHEDFRFSEYRSANRATDRRAFGDLVSWVEGLEEPLLASRVDERIDLDLLSRHWFTIIYCGTQDWAQGAAVLNLREPVPRWFWVHWDLDQSFYPGRSRPARGASLGVILDGGRAGERTDLRAILLRRLIEEDPDFPRRFAYFVADMLAHRIDPEFLRDLEARFARLAVRDRAFGGHDLGAFFEERGAVVLAELRELAGLPDPVRVRVEAAPGSILRIDGFDHGSDYSALHFPGQELSMEAFDSEGDRLDRWVIDGHRRRLDELRFIVDEATGIRVRGR